MAVFENFSFDFVTSMSFLFIASISSSAFVLWDFDSNGMSTSEYFTFRSSDALYVETNAKMHDTINAKPNRQANL